MNVLYYIKKSPSFVPIWPGSAPIIDSGLCKKCKFCNLHTPPTPWGRFQNHQRSQPGSSFEPACGRQHRYISPLSHQLICPPTQHPHACEGEPSGANSTTHRPILLPIAILSVPRTTSLVTADISVQPDAAAHGSLSTSNQKAVAPTHHGVGPWHRPIEIEILGAFGKGR